MAISYTYFELENFPSLQLGQRIRTSTQLGLPQFEGDSAHTDIEFLGNSEHPNFAKFHVWHETIRQIKARIKNDYQNSIIEVMEFNFFKSKNGQKSLVTASSHYCREMFRRLGQDYTDLIWKERKVDLIRFKKELGESIRGGWFTRLKIADVRSVAMFGPTVTESEDWDRYEQSGEISTLHVEFTLPDGHKETVMITKSGTIVLYSTLSEGAQLELVESIDKQIAPFSEAYTVGAESRRRQKE